MKGNHFSVYCSCSRCVIVSVTLQTSTHTSEDRISHSKQQQLDTAINVKLVLGQMQMVTWMISDTLWQRKGGYIPKGHNIEVRRWSRQRGVPKVSVMSLLTLHPHTSAHTRYRENRRVLEHHAWSVHCW